MIELSVCSSASSWLIIAFSLSMVLSLIVYPEHTNGSYFYVKPSVESECLGHDDVPCRTLDEYANNTRDLQGTVTMLFLGGVHNLTVELNLNNLTAFQMRPATDLAHKMVTVTVHLLCDLVLNSVYNLSAENLIIISTKEVSPPPRLVLNNTLAHFRQLHVVGVSVSLTITKRGNFTIQLEDSILETSSETGLQVTVKESMDVQVLNLNVIKSNVSYHQQGGISITIHSEHLNLTVNISDSFVQGNVIKSRRSSTVSNNAAGISIYLNPYLVTNAIIYVYIQNSHLFNNRDLRTHPKVVSQDLTGHPMVVYVSRAVLVEISNCVFQDNHGTAIGAVSISGGLRLYGKVTFLGNYAQQGGALALVSTWVGFMQFSQVLFVNNFANDVGGGIYIDSASVMYDQMCNAACFYQFPDWDGDTSLDRSITFHSNFAKQGGDHIYGASLISCCIVNLYPDLHKIINRQSNDTNVQRVFKLDKQTNSPISSNPSRVCVSDQYIPYQSSEYCADKSQIFKTQVSFPGEKFQFEAVLVGAEFGTGTGSVYAQFLSHDYNKTQLHPSYQYSQRINQTHTSQTLVYSVFSNNSHEVLVLTATDGTVSSDVDEDEIDEAIKDYENYKVIPSILLMTPVYINVSLMKCPPGFYHDPVSMGCKCNPKLCIAQVKGILSNGTGLLYLGGSVWVNAYSNRDISGIVKHENCPFGYCTTDTSRGIDLNHPDTQCAMDHAGTLCGKCETGLSLAIGSNKCLACHDSNGLFLLIFFAGAGIVLVFFIKILNLTVSQGTINGLIFYANIIWAYQSIFFLDTALRSKVQFLFIFVAWINLDFGIEMCFVQGLTAFWKTWLQFIFPLYIWVIAVGMILLARSSKRMTKLFGDNSVQVLATLFLLSYAKLMRIVIVVLVPATLYIYTDDGQPVKSMTQVVWALDGNHPYGRVPHIFLLLVVVLIVIPFVWLPYTFTLLLIKPLRRYSNHRCFGWVNRWKPLIDAYVGPLNSPNHHWVGLLLLARFILLLTLTLTYAENPSLSILSLVIVVFFLLVFLSYTGQLYDHPTRFNSNFLPERVSFCSILELSFLFNLGVLGMTLVYLHEDTGDNSLSKEIIAHISVGIAFIQFIGILLYHLCLLLRKIACKSSSHDSVVLAEYQDLEKEQITDTCPTNSSVNRNAEVCSCVYKDYRHSSYESARYREPWLHASTS